jgi:hypothetical protein
MIKLSNAKPSAIDLDHRRYRNDCAVEQRKGGLWINFFLSINLSFQIAQESHAFRFARVALPQHGGPLLLHIIGKIAIPRNHILNLCQSPNDLVT